jgi:hypothetical protein
MVTNKVVCVSCFNAMSITHVAFSRYNRRAVYRKPSYRSLQRLCDVVDSRVQQQTMGVTLWPEGWWANVLIEQPKVTACVGVR